MLMSPITEPRIIARNALLEGAHQIISKNGWCRKTAHDELGRYCTVGAITASSYRLGMHSDEEAISEPEADAYAAVAKVIGVTWIPDWNDQLPGFLGLGRLRVLSVLKQAQFQPLLDNSDFLD